MTITDRLYSMINRGLQGNNKGLSLGIPTLDKSIYGVMRKELYLLAADSGISRNVRYFLDLSNINIYICICLTKIYINMNRTLIHKRKYLVKGKIHDKAGIYKISCTQSDKIYIGESLDLCKRIQRHFTNLRKGNHHNPILQNIFNKYGEENMIVEILEYV